MPSEGSLVGRPNFCESAVCYRSSEGIAQFYAKTKIHTHTALWYRLFSVSVTAMANREEFLRDKKLLS